MKKVFFMVMTMFSISSFANPIVLHYQSTVRHCIGEDLQDYYLLQAEKECGHKNPYKSFYSQKKLRQTWGDSECPLYEVSEIIARYEC